MIFVCVLLFVVEVIGCEKRTLTHKTTLSHQHHCLFIGLTQQYGCCCADGLWWAILCLLKPARKTKNTLRTFALELNSEIEPQLSQHCKHLLGLCLSIERTSQSKHAFDWDAEDLGHGGVVYWRSDNVPKQPCGGWQWVIADQFSSAYRLSLGLIISISNPAQYHIFALLSTLKKDHYTTHTLVSLYPLQGILTIHYSIWLFPRTIKLVDNHITTMSVIQVCGNHCTSSRTLFTGRLFPVQVVIFCFLVGTVTTGPPAGCGQLMLLV